MRVNVPIDTLLLTVSASDIDETSLPIRYYLDSVNFFPPSSSGSFSNATNLTSVFSLDKVTGELRTLSNLAEYHDGHFEVRVAANNKEFGNCSYALVKVNEVTLISVIFFIRIMLFRNIVIVTANYTPKELQLSNANKY